ncbi:MAG: hypothetical protein PHS59_08930 [Paludibacter sp.]|nr:hypothetical protein [Paludibacter sp.]
MITLSLLYSIGILLSLVFTYLVIILILSLDSLKSSRIEWQVKSKVIMYFACSLVNLISLLFYYFYPTVFVYLNWFIFFTFMLVPVFFYSFLFYITRIDFNEHFSHYHYVLPAFLSLVLLSVSLITPFDGQLQIIKARGICTNDAYKLFFMVSNNKIPIRTGFSTVYLLLAFYRLNRHRKFIVNYSGNDEKNRLGWLQVYLFLAVGLTPLSIAAFFYADRSFLISSSLMLGYNFLTIIQSVYLCYYIVKGKYTVLHEHEELKPVLTVNEVDNKVIKKSLLNRENFEEYILTNKPYLNPDLKITDLVTELGVNRTYISGFINAEYQMNFSNYINKCRIAEFNLLMNDPAYKETSRKELAELVGFSSYKSLKRFYGKEEAER